MRAFGQVNRKRGAVSAAAHAVVAGAVGAADDQRDLRHGRAGHRGDHLGAVLGDAAGLVVASDHEADDVLQEQQRNAALAAQLDEVRGFERALRIEDALVADDADRHAAEMREAGDDGGAVELLELVELGAVDQARDHLAHVVLLLEVDRHDAVELGRVVERLARLASAECRLSFCC